MSVFAWVAVVVLTVLIVLMAGLIGAVRIGLELTLEAQTEPASPEHRELAGLHHDQEGGEQWS
jgi:hypothetical protein